MLFKEGDKGWEDDTYGFDSGQNEKWNASTFADIELIEHRLKMSLR